MLDFEKILTKASCRYYEYPDTTPAPSETSTSFKTPERDLEDRLSLDEVSDVDDDLNLDKSFSKVSYGYYQHSDPISSYINLCPQGFEVET